MLHKLSFDCFR